jgi:hypothetical protein
MVSKMANQDHEGDDTEKSWDDAHDKQRGWGASLRARCLLPIHMFGSQRTGRPASFVPLFVMCIIPENPQKFMSPFPNQENAVLNAGPCAVPQVRK